MDGVGTTLRLWLVWIFMGTCMVLGLFCIFDAVVGYALYGASYSLGIFGISLLFFVLPALFIYDHRRDLRPGRFRYLFVADPKVVQDESDRQIKKELGITELTENDRERWVRLKNQESTGSIKGLFVLIALLFFGIPLFYFGLVIYFSYKDNVSGSSLTIFPVTCSNSSPVPGNCQNPVPLGRIAFKVNPANHSVVEWQPDAVTGDTPIQYQNYTNCGIVDENNWSCTTDYQSSFGMNSGKYFDTSAYNETYFSAGNWEASKPTK